jgi:ATP-binding cassette subfamily B protein
VSDIVTGVGMLSVMLIGATLVLDGRMSIGELVAFAILTHGLAAPFAKLVTVWDTVQTTVRSVQRVHDVLSHPAETSSRPSPDQLVLQKLQGHVRFDAVSFRYAEATSFVLRNVSFECYGGQRIALLGRSGSGKSTIVRLLLGLHSPTSGEISIDGSPVSEIWLPALRRQMGAVLQDTVLFRGSIRANISHTMPAASLGEVIAAATLVNAHRFIAALPAGYDTDLEENGANLSGGQRQQIAIARALLHLPAVIVLDEATSNVDNESARLLQQNLDIAFKDATIVTVTQRLEAARTADLILVLDRGELVEQGAHDELIAREGAYYQLMLSQAV